MEIKSFHPGHQQGEEKGVGPWVTPKTAADMENLLEKFKTSNDTPFLRLMDCVDTAKTKLMLFMSDQGAELGMLHG